MDTPCIEWPHYRTDYGYGQTVIGGRNGRTWLVHRWTWTQTHGPIPAGMCVCHHCDNPPCFNIDHLFLGTRAENNADRVAKGRTRVGVQPGEKNPGAKLTERDVRAIIASNETGVVLAARYGVGKMAISDIRRGVTWRHITSCSQSRA